MIRARVRARLRDAHRQVDVLLDDVAPVRGIDEHVAAVTAEVGDHLLAARAEQRAAVVLQAAADEDRVAAGVQVGARRVVRVQLADADVVVLQRVHRPVVGGLPVGAVAVRVDRPVGRAAVDTAVVADVDVGLAADGAERDRVLVGVRRERAADVAVRRRQRVRPPAGEVEVPVRAGRRPRCAGVLRLVDLLEARVDVIGVRWVDREELVVPGLHAGPVALAADRLLERRARVRELRRLGDLAPRAGRVTGASRRRCRRAACCPPWCRSAGCRA